MRCVIINLFHPPVCGGGMVKLTDSRFPVECLTLDEKNICDKDYASSDRSCGMNSGHGGKTVRWVGRILAGVTFVSFGYLLLLVGTGGMDNTFYTPNSARLVIACALTWIAWCIWARTCNSQDVS